MGQLLPEKSNLSDFPGWWYAMETDDVDGDGDQDLILGNRGENFYFSASKETPAKLWIADFDKNGTIEKIITQQLEGKDMPLAPKRELTTQVVSLKKQNLKHTSYAKRSIQELFSPDELSKSLVLTASCFQSGSSDQ